MSIAEATSERPKEEPPTGLRQRVLHSLREQGFKLSAENSLLAPVNDKESLRSLHGQAVAAQRERGRAALARHEDNFVSRMAAGWTLNPSNVHPELAVLQAGRSADARLWRWCSLHWSIPVSGGYGRRLRALVIDRGHDDAVMGLIGLGDPVYALGVRDQAIGWDLTARQQRLTSVMDAFVLGAVPPYNTLLAGKLTALMLRSDELRDTFAERYGHRQTLISQRDPDAALALITTASALGRSSVYNRVRQEDGSLSMYSVGYTRGTGDFHFSGEIYDLLAEAARASMTDSESTHRHSNWGKGFRNRREVIQRGLSAVGLSPSGMRVHGVQREVFLSPLAANSLAWLRGDDSSLAWATRSAADLGRWWKHNWMEARALSQTHWREFDPQSWRLYTPPQPD